MRQARDERGVRTLALSAAGLATGAGALAAVNRLIAISAGELYSVLDGHEGQYRWGKRTIFYTVRGRGAPLLLIHGLSLGASSFEYRRVFAPLARDFRVYALDLLGFGQSARPVASYTPAVYGRLIQDFAREVMGGVDQPVTVVASGLGAALAVRAAADHPSLFDRLALVAPMGLEARHVALAGLGGRAARLLLRLPLIGEGGYNLLASRAALRLAPGRAVAGEDRRATAARLDYLYLSAHQPGARYALASLWTGQVAESASWPELTQPALLVSGTAARHSAVDQARAFREANPRAEIVVLPAGHRPHEEAPDAFARALRTWLRAPSTTRG